MTRPDEYLVIPQAYGEWLGGLRWAGNWEAVEFQEPRSATKASPAYGAEKAAGPTVLS